MLVVADVCINSAVSLTTFIIITTAMDSKEKMFTINKIAISALAASPININFFAPIFRTKKEIANVNNIGIDCTNPDNAKTAIEFVSYKTYQ